MNVKAVLDKFGDKRILVVGDLILDYFVWGDVDRISPEAPVPVVDVKREDFLLGGAGNVANNINALGGNAAICGVIGGDHHGEILISMLKEKNIDAVGVTRDKRPTTVKTRVIANGQQVVRFDREERREVAGSALSGIYRYITNNIKNFDAVIVSDYKKGVISPRLVRYLLAQGLPFIAVDPKVGHFHYYKGVSLITPNKKEAQEGAGVIIRDERTLEMAGRRLLNKLRCKSVLITRGDEGMSLFTDQDVYHIPTAAKEVFDVTGAGDTVISAFTMACVSGAGLAEAATIANHAAGIVVGALGTATTTTEEILRSMGIKAN